MKKYFLETKRLGFRLLEKADIEYLFDLESDPDVQQFSLSGGVKSREQTEALIDECIVDYEVNSLPSFLLFELASGEFIGRASFIFWKTGDIEVGYNFHKKFWGKGYATEALTALLVWARKNISADYISACTAINNVGSIRVLEKCGMEYYKSGNEEGIECRFYRIKNR